MTAIDGTDDVDVGADIIPFPNMRQSRAIAEAWAIEVAARNQRSQTRHRFPSPLGVLDDLMRRRAMPPLPWPADWPELARRARCHPGDSIAIIGPQGGGKTSFAIQLCRAAMGSGIPCLWCALELDETQIAVRIVANLHGIHSIAIREHWSKERIAHALASVDDLWRFVDRHSDPDVQLAALRDAIALAKKIYRVPPLVVIDYLGKLASLARDIRVGTIHAAEQLRAIAVGEECIVAMLAQPSRGSGMLLTGRTDIDSATDAIGVAGESAEVESACRVVLGINLFKIDDASELDAHILVTKSNTGLEGRVGFRFQKAGGVWTELDHLPPTPNAIKIKVAKDAKDKHRVLPPPTPAEARADLTLTAIADAETLRRRALLEAITRHGAIGMARDQMRLVIGVGRGPEYRRSLAELIKAGAIEQLPGDRFRITSTTRR